jgi:hypothetical protein
MSIARAIIIASICLGLTAAAAQQREVSTAATAKSPPLFEGIVVDAKKKTVGSFMIAPFAIPFLNYVVRQFSGAWVVLRIEPVAGFLLTDPGDIEYWYTSSDCSGQTYLQVGHVQEGQSNFVAMGLTSIIPPSTQPSIYFAGLPWASLASNSTRTPGSPCHSGPQGDVYAGPLQSVPVSSLGLTLPFSVK